MSRQLTDWLSNYLELTEDGEPPYLFKLWSGISTIAACLQRKCFMTWKTEIYPNMYVVIVGPSGCRKGTAMGPCLDLLYDTNVPLAAESITREALIQRLKKTTSNTPGPDGMAVLHSSITIFSPELAVFIGQNNPTLISSLTDWYDCRKKWTYETKNMGTDFIQGVWVNLIGATTPSLLQNTLPRDAIGGGLTSRIIFVYGDKKSKLNPCPIWGEWHWALREKLLADLESIVAMSGQFTINKDYTDLYMDWYITQSKKPAIRDPNFAPYLERRPTHLRKLSMIMSASRSDELQLTTQDFERALAILEDTERRMACVFQGYGRDKSAELFPPLTRLIRMEGPITFGKIIAYFHLDSNREELQQMVTALCQMDPPFAKMKWIVDKNTGEKDMLISCIDDPQSESHYGTLLGDLE